MCLKKKNASLVTLFEGCRSFFFHNSFIPFFFHRAKYCILNICLRFKSLFLKAIYCHFRSLKIDWENFKFNQLLDGIVVVEIIWLVSLVVINNKNYMLINELSYLLFTFAMRLSLASIQKEPQKSCSCLFVIALKVEFVHIIKTLLVLE